MIPSSRPRTETTTVGATLELTMSNYHMHFIGTRADSYTVTGVKDPIEYEREDGVITTGVPKEVEHYTVSCDECGGTGFYDQIGEIICEDCGMVLSGDDQPIVMTEFGDSDDGIGSSRGFEKMGEVRGPDIPGI
jgi:hypothetical protein